MNIREDLLIVCLVFYGIVFFDLEEPLKARTLPLQGYNLSYFQVFALIVFGATIYFFITAMKKNKKPSSRTRTVKRETLPPEETAQEV